MRNATLSLYDPTRLGTLRVAGATRTLGADFGAPLAYYPEPGLLLGFMAMLRPANYENRAGTYMLEPFDPDRIPVILIHGLTSIPQMWLPTISAIESDPKLRGRYQFWVFAYPPDGRSDSADRARAQAKFGACLSTLSQNEGHGAH